MAYPSLISEDPTFLKTNRNDEIEDLEQKSEKHVCENILNLLKIDNDYFRKKYENLKKRRIELFISETLYGSGSGRSSSTFSLLNPSVGIFATSATALLPSIAILIINENISKTKTRYTKLRGWLNVIT